MVLTKEEGRALLALARSAVIAAANGAAPPRADDTPTNARHAGAFVTIHARGELRGCIGQPEPSGPLGAVIVHCARAAALEDPRFPPLSARELPFVDVEVSVLTPPARVTDPASIEVGRHGLIVARGGRRGLLLPQVPVEWGWGREEFLARTCQKAGLPFDAWQHGAELFAFEAQVFSEATRA